MRILYSHRTLARDGQRIHIDAMVASLRAAGHEVRVCGPKEPPARAAAAGTGLRRRISPRLHELAELAYNLVAVARIVRACLTFRPDIVYERHNLFFFAGLVAKRLFGLPLLLEVNAPLSAERSEYSGLDARLLARRSEHAVWKAADMVLPVSDALARFVRAAGVPAERVTVIRNGIDATPWDRATARAGRARLGVTQDDFVIGFVGYVRDWHGLDAVLARMAAQPIERGKLAVVGDGPALPALRERAAALGVSDRLILTGAVAHRDVPDLVAAFDVALQPAAVAYASPLKLFEYMVAGRAIVAPDQENVRDLLRDGETALLFPPGDAASLWRRVVELAADPALCVSLGVAARQSVFDRDLTWDGNARRVTGLAQALCKQRVPVGELAPDEA